MGLNINVAQKAFGYWSKDFNTRPDSSRNLNFFNFISFAGRYNPGDPIDNFFQDMENALEGSQAFGDGIDGNLLDSDKYVEKDGVIYCEAKNGSYVRMNIQDGKVEELTKEQVLQELGIDPNESNSPSRGAVWDLQQLYFTFTVSNPKFSKYFEAWIQHEPNNPTPWIARGLHRRIQGKRVLSHNPTNETLVARLEAKKAFMQAAEQDLLHAIAINPNNPLARGYLKSVTRSLDLNGKLFMQEPAEVLARLRKKNKAIYESSEEAYKTQSKWVASKANRIPALLETIDDMAGYEQECVGLSSFLLLRGIPHDLSPRARCLYNQQKYAEAKEVLEEILATSSKPNKWATEKLQAVNERLNGI